MDYRKCAQEIFDKLGGRDNLVSAAHCATRLRLVTVDNSKIDKEALEDVDGVKGIFESNGQIQIIIGTGTVNKVYDEFLDIAGMTAATKDDVKAAAAAQMPWWKKLLKIPGDVFVPILPAIVASGLMMGLVEALGKAVPGFASTDWYGFLDMVANTAFAFLPVLVAVSASRVFGGNTFLGAVIGLLMIHTNLINAWSAGSVEIPVWHLFFFNVPQVGYQGHVIPVILAVYLMCVIEKWLHKHVPEVIDLFVTPLCTVLATAFVTFTIIGPIFSTVETWVLNGAQTLITVGFGVGSLVMGAIYPLTVVMGLHHMYNVIEAGMLSAGDGALNIWMPIASAANFAQFGACLAVAVKARSQKTKAVALPSSLSASLGITEPAIFGVNFRFMKPFVAGMIGGAIGAWFGSITHLGASTYGVTGIPGLLAINNVPVYCIELLISAGVAFAIAWFIWKEDEADGKKGEQKAAEPDVPAEPQKPVISCSAGEILASVPGKVISYTEIPDETFASGALGSGVGIWPENGTVVAPFDGEISSVTDTRHAVGITGPDDMEVLIHVGVDTVAMNGDGFECLVNEGDTVKAGQPLIKFNRDKIKAAKHPDVVVVLLTNSDDYENVDLKVSESFCQPNT